MPHATVALSIQQPWAWLIVNGLKDIENRTWWTSRRGRILIHTGMKLDRDAHETLMDGFHPVMGSLFDPGRYIDDVANGRRPLGGIVGSAEIVDCVGASGSPWFVGPRGFVLRNAQRLDFMPLKGALGFFPARYEPPTG